MKRRNKEKSKFEKIILNLDRITLAKLSYLLPKEKNRSQFINDILKEAINNSKFINHCVKIDSNNQRKRRVLLHTCDDNLIKAVGYDKEDDFWFKKCELCGDEIEIFKEELNQEELDYCKETYGKMPNNGD